MHSMTEENGTATSDAPTEQVAQTAPAVTPVIPPVAPPAPTPQATPKYEGRPFDPDLAQNMLKIPGAKEWLADQLGVTDMQRELARGMAMTKLGLSEGTAAKLNGTPEQIITTAKLLADELARQKAQLVPDAAGQTPAVTTPGNPAQNGEPAASEFIRTMQQLISGAPPATQADPDTAALAAYRAHRDRS
jgi:hypothetical protein